MPEGHLNRSSAALALPDGGEEFWGDGEHDPCPLELAVVVGALQSDHRVGAAHERIAGADGGVFHELVGDGGLHLVTE